MEKETSGIKFDRLPYNSGCNWTIPIKITDKLDRDNVEDFKFNFCPCILKSKLLRIGDTKEISC